eukprot:scpid94355/ scgid2408/ 
MWCCHPGSCSPIEWFHIYHMAIQGSHVGSNSTQLLDPASMGHVMSAMLVPAPVTGCIYGSHAVGHVGSTVHMPWSLSAQSWSHAFLEAAVCLYGYMCGRVCVCV